MIVLALFLATQAEPTGTLQFAIAMTEDYPSVARRKGWEGDVQAELTLNEKGRVSACKVLQSSGYPILDEQTCKIMKSRARFKWSGEDRTFTTVRTPVIQWRLRP